MQRGRGLRGAGPLAIVLVFASVWLGHTLEYVRVGGTAGLQNELFGSVHAYMLPALAILAILSSFCVGWLLRVAQLLAVRVARARDALTAAWRGGPVPPRRPSDEAGVPAPGVLLWLLLAPIELGVYLLQENLEAVRLGLPAPGLGPLVGAHWAAPYLHLAVLFCGALVLARAFRHLRSCADELAVVERILRIISERRRDQPPHQPPAHSWIGTPIQRHGRQIWGRPPPPSPLPA